MFEHGEEEENMNGKGGKAEGNVGNKYEESTENNHRGERWKGEMNNFKGFGNDKERKLEEDDKVKQHDEIGEIIEMSDPEEIDKNLNERKKKEKIERRKRLRKKVTEMIMKGR